jgi:hypothetical protein
VFIGEQTLLWPRKLEKGQKWVTRNKNHRLTYLLKVRTPAFRFAFLATVEGDASSDLVGATGISIRLG